MTGEVSPVSGPGEHRPELRASHEDRDRVVEVLRVAAGDGRLTADELDQRLEAALTARTYSELAVLTADLPAMAGRGGSMAPVKRKDVMRIAHRGGSARQVGHWVVPRRMEIEVTGGNVQLDFTEAVITGAALQIDARVNGGHLVIITRPGVVVDASEVSMTGGNIYNRPARGSDVPVTLAVEISGKVRGGNIRVRGPRRSVWQWLTRRPLGPR